MRAGGGAVTVLIAFTLLVICAYAGFHRWSQESDPAQSAHLRLVQSPEAATAAAAGGGGREKHPIVNMNVMTPNGVGEVVIEVRKDWAPLGAERFLSLVGEGFYDETRFFRVLKSFVAQIGISGNPAIAAKTNNMHILDDPVVTSNKRGTVTFATGGKNTRSSQIFFNLVDNRFLDKEGFSPFAVVVKGMEHIDALYNGYGEGGRGDGKDGRGPNQGRIVREGNSYLNAVFPKLSYIVSAKLAK